MNYFYLIADCLLFSHVIIAIIGFYFYLRVDKVLKILVIFLVITAIVEATTRYMATNKIDNIWLMNIYILLHYIFLSLIFSFWQTNQKVKYSLRIGIPVYLMAWVTKNLWYGEINTWDNFSYSLSTILITGIALYTLITFQLDESTPKLKEPRFWVSAIVVISYGGNIFINSLIITSLLPQSNTLLVWSLRNVIFILANLSYTGCFLWNYRPSISGQS